MKKPEKCCGVGTYEHQVPMPLGGHAGAAGFQCGWEYFDSLFTVVEPNFVIGQVVKQSKTQWKVSKEVADSE